MPDVASSFEVLTECVREQLADETIAWGIFRVAESQKDSPRRVVWIPIGGQCTGVMMTNPLRDSETDELGDSLQTDRTMVECHITGNDFEDACNIRVQVLNAARQALRTSSVATHVDYVTEQDGHSGHMWGGQAKIVQMFEWQINVPKPDQFKATVIEIDQTSELQNIAATDELLTITPP